MKRMILITLVLSSSVFAYGRFKAQGTWQNQQGGISSVHGSGFSGPQGRKMGRGRAVYSDGSGSVSGGSAQSVQTLNGGQAGRWGRFNRNAGGGIQRQGGAGFNSAYGSGSSQSYFNSNGQGQFEGGRNTSIQGSQGGSYEGQTTYSNTEGISHSGTCTNPQGEQISC